MCLKTRRVTKRDTLVLATLRYTLVNFDSVVSLQLGVILNSPLVMSDNFYPMILECPIFKKNNIEGSCLMRLLGPFIAKNRIRKMTTLIKLTVHKNRIRQIFSNGFEKSQQRNLQ